MDTCPVCFSPFRKPKVLPCLDTVCFSCLDDHVIKHGRQHGTFPCPVCNIELPVPDGGITKFDDNQHVQGEQTLETVPDIKLPCEICDDKRDAVQRCIECEQNFCNSCSKAHLRLNIAKTHTFVSLSGPEGKRYLTSTAYCDKHTREQLTFYCRTCLTPVCLRCRLTIHEDHTTEDLADFAASARKQLRIALDENKGYRFSMLGEIEELRQRSQEISLKNKSIKKSISQRRQQFHNAVDEICNEMVTRLDRETKIETERLEEDKNLAEEDMLKLSSKIATANQIVDFGSDMEIVRGQTNILGSLALAKKEVPLSMTGVKLDLDFSYQRQAGLSLRYLVGRLSADLMPPNYINVVEVATFRVENTSDVINSICPAPDGNCWIACGWKPEIALYDRHGKKCREKKVGRDVDCLAIDSDGNSYVSCRDEHSVKRFDRNFRRRMATLDIQYPRGIATTSDNKLVICVNETTTYFEYESKHKNKVLKLGPDGDHSKELKNPSFSFMYPIRVAVNTNDELCVSDNLKNAVLFIRSNGELKTTYTGERKADDIALVRTTSPRTRQATAKTVQTSTPQPGNMLPFRPPDSIKHIDGPDIGTPSKSVLERTQTPPNSPKTAPTSGKLLTLTNYTYESSFESESETLDGSETDHVDKPPHLKALTGLTGGLDTASVTEVDSVAEYLQSVPPFDPRGITCDKYGHVIVADYTGNMVHLLDKHGRFLMYLLTEADGIFGPTSVAVDRNGLLWVGGGNATVKIYKYVEYDARV